MTSNDYHFVTTWRVHGTLEEITDLIGNAPDLVRWWPSVYLDVQQLAAGDKSGLGKEAALYTKGWLPYTLRWKFRVTDVRHPHGFTLEARGDFVGRGTWTFEAEAVAPEAVPDPKRAGWIKITYDWKIAAEKPLLKYLSFVMKPIFAANHHWAMARGEESLKLELARRHADDPEQLRQIPPPPGPTFAFLMPKDGRAALAKPGRPSH